MTIQFRNVHLCIYLKCDGLAVFLRYFALMKAKVLMQFPSGSFSDWALGSVE